MQYIRAIKVITNEVGVVLHSQRDLRANIHSEEPIKTVSAEGAYDTRNCYAVIYVRGAKVIISVCKNGRLKLLYL